jgi:hypothetical protein
MKLPDFVYLNSISKEDIRTIEDLLKNKRLRKYLWIEFILNPEAVKLSESCMENAIIKESLTDALSWYLAFRWLFQKNEILEKLHKRKTIIPYRIRDNIYRQKRRSFLKGILHARLC